MANQFKKNINAQPKKEGVAKRQEMLDDLFKNQGFIPKEVLIGDMDLSFVEYVENKLSITAEGEKLPVIFLTLQRWTEFTKTWKFTDKYKDIKMPFITIVKQPNVQRGTNQAGLWNIAGKRHYTTYKVPTLYGGGRKGIDLYMIPQPTAVDITYEVRLFSNKMRANNEMDENILKAFKSQQHYIWPNAHPMPVTLENIGDESTIDDFENRRFYIIMYEMKLAGYILDSKDFIVKPAVDRTILVTEIEEEIIAPRFKLRNNAIAKTFNYGIIFEPRSNSSFSFQSEYALKITNLVNIENISNIDILVNGVTMFSGLAFNTTIIVNAGDTIFINVTKSDLSTCKFTLTGNLII